MGKKPIGNLMFIPDTIQNKNQRPHPANRIGS